MAREVMAAGGDRLGHAVAGWRRRWEPPAEGTAIAGETGTSPILTEWVGALGGPLIRYHRSLGAATCGHPTSVRVTSSTHDFSQGEVILSFGDDFSRPGPGHGAPARVAKSHGSTGRGRQFVMSPPG